MTVGGGVPAHAHPIVLSWLFNIVTFHFYCILWLTLAMKLFLYPFKPFPAALKSDL